jgi:predicted nucleic acid-binding protein
MILIDTSTIVAWLDAGHPDHRTASDAVVEALANEQAAVSVVTLAELAAGGRTQEAIDDDLLGMVIVDLTAGDAERAGQVYSRTPRKQRLPLPDFFIRAQAAERGWKHLTNDRRRLAWWPDVEFVFGNDEVTRRTRP